MIREWQQSDGLKPLTAGASYDWEKNRIILSVNYPNVKFNKITCMGVLINLRSFGNVASGTLAGNLSESLYAKQFNHFGYARTKEPKNLGNSIDDLIRITVKMKNGKCEGRLVLKEMSFEERK